MLPDMNLSIGLGPRQADVICVTIGSASSVSKLCLHMSSHTGVDGVVEPLSGHGRVLLDIALVVVERAVFAGLEVVGVLHHFGVEFVEGAVGDHVFEDDEAVAGESADGDFEVGAGEMAVAYFGWGRGDRYGGGGQGHGEGDVIGLGEGSKRGTVYVEIVGSEVESSDGLVIAAFYGIREEGSAMTSESQS